MKKLIVVMMISLLLLSAVSISAAGNQPEKVSIDEDFETVRPEVDVQPAQSVTVMVRTPSGKSVSIAITINGKDR